jgi:pimeloyl-ACP methyl ester carboxylesterase
MRRLGRSSTSAAERVMLVAHDMGSSVATELLARDLQGRLAFELVSVLLFNASSGLEGSPGREADEAGRRAHAQIGNPMLGSIAVRPRETLPYRARDCSAIAAGSWNRDRTPSLW